MDTGRVCSVCDAKLSAETQRSVAMFAEVVWHVLVNLGRTEGQIYRFHVARHQRRNLSHSLSSELNGILKSFQYAIQTD